ncbi:hypothetical protein [Yersinia mollaretii]|uniref:hypothetical protein n=1 Tax=Yersinia mollaretii TaxID=33060 RepID=UPI0021BD19FB|nr:hypothetical protein [Yersinia mollaretii]
MSPPYGFILKTTTNPNVYYTTLSVGSAKSLLNENLVLSNGLFFKDRITINFSLEKSKENEVFNNCMIEKACHSTSGNYFDAIHPIVNKNDKANISVAMNSRKLKEKIACEYAYLCKTPNGSALMPEGFYQGRAEKIINKLIEKELGGVNSLDIDPIKWINTNPLTSAMLTCIKDDHDQSDINSIVLDRVINFYSSKKIVEMKEISFLDECIALHIDEIVKFVFSPEGNNMTSTNDIAANIKRKVERMASEIRIHPEVKIAELKQFDDFIKQFP